MRRHLDHRGHVVFAPQALLEMSHGFCELASLLAGTLGPQRGPIWHANGERVERLTDSGTIVRRIVELPERLPNAGAMQLRHAVWRMHELFGDGGATVAVLARAMLMRANRHVSAGIDPVMLRQGMESSLAVVEDALEAHRLPASASSVERLIAASLPDPGIASVLAEMVEVLGTEPAIHLEVMAQPYLDRVYLNGGYWKLQPSSRTTLPPGKNDLVLESPLVLVADDEVLEADHLVRVFDLLVRDYPRRPLVIVGAKLTSGAQDLLNLNMARGTLTAYAVSPTVTSVERHQVLQDVALATGSELVSTVRGWSPESFQASWMGSARQVVLRHDSVIVIEGGGDQARIQQRQHEIRGQIERAAAGDATSRLRERLASLAGGIGILQIGGLTQAERDDRRRHVERALRMLPDVVGSGQVPGGGVAYLACRPALHQHAATLEPGDQRFGVDVVSCGLESPFLQLVANGGVVVPAVALEQVTDAECRLAFDASTGDMVPVDDLPVADSLAVVRGALRLATSAVAEMIATGATVLPRESRRSVSADP